MIERGKIMVLVGTLKTEDVGAIIYDGTTEECKEHSKELNLEDYYDLHICSEDGVIQERLVN